MTDHNREALREVLEGFSRNVPEEPTGYWMWGQLTELLIGVGWYGDRELAADLLRIFADSVGLILLDEPPTEEEEPCWECWVRPRVAQIVDHVFEQREES